MALAQMARQTGRQICGSGNYWSGQAAEAQVAAEYQRRGCELVETRWRGRAGEVDLILRTGSALVFVEVKRAPDFAAAAARISPAQVRRITATAGEYLAREPGGQLTEVRFDAALVDATGRIEIIPNAFDAG